MLCANDFLSVIHLHSLVQAAHFAAPVVHGHLHDLGRRAAGIVDGEIQDRNCKAGRLADRDATAGRSIEDFEEELEGDGGDEGNCFPSMRTFCRGGKLSARSRENQGKLGLRSGEEAERKG